jgi:hypothetical protein
MTQAIVNAQAVSASQAVPGSQAVFGSQAVWLPKRVSGTSWEVIEQTLGISRTGKEDENSQCTCEVILPAGWSIVESEASFFQRYLVDSNGKQRAKLFYKNYRADFILLIED